MNDAKPASRGVKLQRHRGSPDAIKQVSRGTLPVEIVNSIAGMLMQGIWKPGDMIPSEKELAARFGVGRSTIREAVKSLVVIGVLEARPGEGSFVREPDTKIMTGAFRWGLLLSERNIGDLVDVRMLVEAQCAFRAATRATPTDIERLNRSIELIAQKQNQHHDFMRHDNEFHVEIAGIAGNVLLSSISSTIQEIVGVWYPVTYYQPRMKALTIAEHVSIVEAIESGEPETAQTAMETHIKRAAARLEAELR